MRSRFVQEGARAGRTVSTVQQHEQRRRRWPYIVIAAVCVFAAVVGWQLYGVPRVSAVTPGPDAYVKTPSPTVVLDIRGLADLKDVAVTLDGEDVTAQSRRDGDTLTITAGDLADGEHAVAFRASSSNLFRRDVRKDWRFTVDTSIPKLELEDALTEGRINTDPATFSGITEPYATVTIADGDVKASAQADAAGRYAVSADLPDGDSRGRHHHRRPRRQHAGEAAERVRRRAAAGTQDDAAWTRRSAKSRFTVRIKATDQLGVPAVEARARRRRARARRPRLQGQVRRQGPRPGQAHHRRHGRGQGRQRGHPQGDLRRRQYRALRLRHPVAGRARQGRQGSCSPSSSDADVYSGKKTGYYDDATEKAVRKLQAKYGLEVDGIVGGNVLNALSGQIVVDLGDLKLYLYRDGKLVKSYSVATGQSAFPTPTGSYVVTSKVMNPTWYPPNSDWAKDAKPIPPGIENPLGTRWIGTSAPGVGIHGTPDDSSIGTYASHGCIRMHIWDVEDLFERVVIGLPVIIRR